MLCCGNTCKFDKFKGTKIDILGLAEKTLARANRFQAVCQSQKKKMNAERVDLDQAKETLAKGNLLFEQCLHSIQFLRWQTWSCHVALVIFQRNRDERQHQSQLQWAAETPVFNCAMHVFGGDERWADYFVRSCFSEDADNGRRNAGSFVWSLDVSDYGGCEASLGGC
jgi:hypothetical protein